MAEGIYFYKTVKDDLVRISLLEKEDCVFTYFIPLKRKTAFYALANRVYTYCKEKEFNLPWVGSKFILEEKDIPIIEASLDYKASSNIPVHTFLVDFKSSGLCDMKVTDILYKGYKHLYFLDTAMTSRNLNALLVDYAELAYTKTGKVKTNKDLKIDQKTLESILPISRVATEKDFPYVEDKPDFKLKSQTTSGVKAYFIYEKLDSYQVSSQFSTTKTLLKSFSLPKDYSGNALTLIEEVGGDSTGIINEEVLLKLLERLKEL